MLRVVTFAAGVHVGILVHFLLAKNQPSQRPAHRKSGIHTTENLDRMRASVLRDLCAKAVSETDLKAYKVFSGRAGIRGSLCYLKHRRSSAGMEGQRNVLHCTELAAIRNMLVLKTEHNPLCTPVTQ